MALWWYGLCTIFFCMYVYGENSLWTAAYGPIENKSQFHGVCMDTWTRIDLVQAIATSKRQKRAILRSLVKSLMCLSASLATISHAKDSHFYKELMQSMYFSFCSAFPWCRNRAYKECLVLLTCMIKRLEDPVDLEAENTS